MGDFFTPISLAGYSSTSATVCFYPFGQREGDYEFHVIGKTTHPKGQADARIVQTFLVKVDAGMVTILQQQADGEYPYSFPIELVP